MGPGEGKPQAGHDWRCRKQPLKHLNLIAAAGDTHPMGGRPEPGLIKNKGKRRKARWRGKGEKNTTKEGRKMKK